MRSFAVLLILLSVIQAFAKPAAADLIIVNANVRTMASAQPRAEAIAVSGGEIIAVGSTKTIRSLTDENTKIIDAGGKLVLPGFNDAHVHFAAIGNTFSSVKLNDVKTPAEFAARIANIAKFIPKGRWILGSGWDNRSWIPNDPPTGALVDEGTRDNPVFVYNTDATAVFVNSKALRIAGIDEATKDPNGGAVRDEERPSGDENPCDKQQERRKLGRHLVVPDQNQLQKRADRSGKQAAEQDASDGWKRAGFHPRTVPQRSRPPEGDPCVRRLCD